MSLSTLSDYQTFLYKFTHSVENSVGLDIEQVARHEGIAQADVVTFLANYTAWKQANLSKRVDGTFTTTA